MTTVHGNRRCRVCKFLCESGAWRQNFQRRKGYFCCEADLLWYVNNRIARLTGNYDHFKHFEYFISSAAEWIEYRDEHFEQVDVIPSQEH